MQPLASLVACLGKCQFRLAVFFGCPFPCILRLSVVVGSHLSCVIFNRVRDSQHAASFARKFLRLFARLNYCFQVFAVYLALIPCVVAAGCDGGRILP